MVKYEKPLVSVIIPSYNAEKFVEQAVRSIMEQTYWNLEIICINDYSKDSTGSILQKLAKEDSRIIYVENEENLKLPKTLNKGIALAKGEYIARMDADDIALPERIERQVSFLLESPDIDIVGTNVFTIDESGYFLNYTSNMVRTSQEIAKKIAWKTCLLHPTVLAKSSFFRDLHGFDESLLYAEDYDLWIRATLDGKKIANIPDVLLKYRVHKNQMSDVKFNKRNANIVRGFLWKYFLQTKNIFFLFGCLLQTRLFYYLVRKTSSIRRKIKFL